jgi:hypothetical protein
MRRPGNQEIRSCLFLVSWLPYDRYCSFSRFRGLNLSVVRSLSEPTADPR